MSTPPRQDEQEQNSYQPQRRRRSTPYQRPPMDYSSDEHPEVPKIRRASLYLEQQSAQLPDDPEVDDERAAKKPKPKQGRRPYQYPPDNPRNSSVSQQRHSPVYEPPPPARRLRHTRPKRSLYAQLQYLSHNRPFLVIGALLIIAVVIVPIIVSATHSQTLNSLSGISTGSNTLSSGSQQLSNPHELIIAPQDTDHPAPPVFATSAYLLDADTGVTLYAHKPFMHLPMLSTTKLMTAVLAIEHGNPDQKITITNAIASDVSQLSADSSMFGFKKGETYTLREMLAGLLLPSGNDAAIAIADTIGGNLPVFVAEMNLRAHQLGLYDTHYVNPHGLLSDGQFSSAHDLAVLGRFSLSLPLIHQISSTQIYRIPKGGNHPARILINGNQFLWWYPGVDGGKTGAAPSDLIQVVSCIHDHHHLIGVVMHTINWWTDMRDLMNWGFNSFNWVSPYDVDLQHPIPYDDLWDYFASDKKEKTIATADSGRYYVYTGFSISGSILTYFDQAGGLKKFGYPISLPTVSSTSVVTQRFEQSTIQCDLTTKQCTTV